MRKLIVGFLMFGLIFGTSVVVKAAPDIRFVKDRGYSSTYDNFSVWEGSQRDRISDLYEDRAITRYDFDRLNGQLSNIEGYHNQVSSKGWISHREQKKLEKMEAGLSADVDRVMNQHVH